MSPFWVGLFENLRGRGRNAALFIFVVPTLIVAAIVASQIPEPVYRQSILPASPFVGLAAVGLFGRAFWRERARQRQRIGRSTLSDDERCKARAKLVRRQEPVFPKNSLVPPG